MKIKTEPITEQWNVSKINFIDDVIKQYDFAEKIIIADCTLRDGEQQAGIVFTKEDKVAIAKQLNKLGVHEIEVGMPAVSQEDMDAAQAILALGLNSKATALSRAVEGDIDLLVNLGIDNITISLPIGDMQRKYKLKWDDQKYLAKALQITEYAKKKGLHVSLSPFDTTRVELDFLDLFLKTMKGSGTIDRIRVVDTVGSASPAAIKYLVKRVKNGLGGNIPIEIHCHDDFGLAAAATIAGVEAGASIISSTINGIGERSGNAATEEVVMALRVLYGLDLGIKLNYLTETSQLIEQLSGIKLQRHKPVVGLNSFSYESGLVVSGFIEMNFTTEAYIPEIVGQERHIVIGKKSGKASIEYKLKERGLVLSDTDIELMVQKVKECAIKLKRAISDEEFLELIAELKK